MNFFDTLGLSPNSLRARAGMPGMPAQSPVTAPPATAPVPQAPQNFLAARAGMMPQQSMTQSPMMQAPMQQPMRPPMLQQAPPNLQGQQPPPQQAPQNFLRARMGM